MEIYKEEKFDLPHWYQSELTINHQFIEYKKNHYCSVNNSILSVSYKRECKQFVNLANKY